MARSSRPSHANAPGRALYSSHQEKRDLEARNGLQQFDRTLEMVAQQGGHFQLTPDMVCELQGYAIRDIYSCAGKFRWDAIDISNTRHTPPPADEVVTWVDEMCEYTNKQTDFLHCSAYLMWRVNWIHPFFGGNGRTSRVVSYLAMCVLSIGKPLPGTNTVPDQIVSQRQPYYEALDDADAAFARDGSIDVSTMESLLHQLLQKQLLSASP